MGRGSGNPQPTGWRLTGASHLPFPRLLHRLSLPPFILEAPGASLPPPPAWSVWQRRGSKAEGWGVTLAGDRAQGAPPPSAPPIRAYPEPGCLGLGEAEAWVRGVLQGRDDGGCVDQGVAEAEVAQHRGEGGQEHPLVLQGAGGSAGAGREVGVLSPPFPTAACADDVEAALGRAGPGPSDWHLQGLDASSPGKAPRPVAVAVAVAEPRLVHGRCLLSALPPRLAV